MGAGLSVLIIPVAANFYVLATLAGMYGLCLGSWFLLVPVLLADDYGTSKISSTYGLVRLFQSFAAMTVPPFSGLFFSSFRTCNSPFFRVSSGCDWKL